MSSFYNDLSVHKLWVIKTCIKKFMIFHKVKKLKKADIAKITELQK